MAEPPSRHTVPFSWLRDALVRLGTRWTEELMYIEDTVALMLERGTDWRQAARVLGRELRKLKIDVDAEQIVWTAISRVRSRSAWDFNAAQWRRWARRTTDERFVFRITAADACRGCWWLAYETDGMPSLYRPEDIEVWDLLPPNRGHISTWTPRIGPNHDGCRCPSWLDWDPVMTSIAEARKAQRAAHMRRLGLDRLEAAILRRRR
jgi:hypothetical protein